MLLAFVVTLVPFYHGAMRHPDATCRGPRADSAREGSLLPDFYLLFIEACLSLAFAGVATNTIHAACPMVALPGVDGLWGISAYFVFAKTRRPRVEVRWTVISVATAAVVVLLLQAVFMWPGDGGLQVASSDTPQTLRIFDFIVKARVRGAPHRNSVRAWRTKAMVESGTRRFRRSGYLGTSPSSPSVS